MTTNTGIVLLAASVSLLGQTHSRYWVKSTPHRTESRMCTVVRNEEALRRELEAIQWRDSVPDVKWANDVAVIVAPQQSHRGSTLAFFKVADPETNPSLEWGWYQPSTSSRTYGGIIDNGPAAIVVAVPTAMVDRGLRCREVETRWRPSHSGRWLPEFFMALGSGGSLVDKSSASLVAPPRRENDLPDVGRVG